MSRRDSLFRPFFWALLLLFAAGLLPQSLLAQQSNVTVTVPEVGADSGETVTLSIEADLGGNEVDSYTNMEFTFDSSVLNIVAARDGDELSFGSDNLVANTEGDTLRVTNIADDPPVSGSGEFLEIDVKLTQEAGSAFELTPSSTETFIPTSVFGLPDGGNLEIDEIDQGLVGKISQAVPLPSGWTLASIPLSTDQPFGDLLPPCQSGFFFEPGTGYTLIESGDSVPQGQGFFANCSAGTVQVQGFPPDSSSIPVDQGWNIIGALDDTISVASITTTPAGIVQTSFFGFNQGYQSADPLVPGQGYWVKVSQQGELNLSPENAPSSSLTSDRVANSEPERVIDSGPPDRSGKTLRLRVTDSRGRSATLRLAHTLSTSRKEGFALPPKPPGGLFDVRFATGYAAVSLKTQSQAEPSARSLPDVEFQSLKFPVEVHLRGPMSKGQVLALSAPTGRTARLSDQRRNVSLTKSTDRLQLALQAVPTEFALRKSRPHPVSGQATIEYAVATQTEVSLEVFDALGRRVMELVDGRRQAGMHKVQVSANQLPSGTYFVRMQTDQFRKTRHLTVVR